MKKSPRKLRKVQLTKRLKERIRETDTWKTVWKQFEKGKLRSFAGHNQRGGLRRGPVVKSKFQAYFIAVKMSGRELGYQVKTK